MSPCMVLLYEVECEMVGAVLELKGCASSNDCDCGCRGWGGLNQIRRQVGVVFGIAQDQQTARCRFELGIQSIYRAERLDDGTFGIAIDLLHRLETSLRHSSK